MRGSAAVLFLAIDAFCALGSEMPMEVRLRGVLAENRDKPYVVTKVKLLKAFFENVRLKVNKDDVFVDTYPDQWIITKFREERFTDFAKRTPGLEDTWDWWKSTADMCRTLIRPIHAPTGSRC